MLRVEDLELDPALRKIRRAERDMKLSPKEFDLLHLLMRRAGCTVTRQELLQQAWGLQPETDSNLVDVYVNYLRKKVDAVNEEKLIHTVRGSGYRIGRPAPTMNGNSENTATESGTRIQGATPQIHSTEPGIVQQTPWRSLVNSVAQPLTNVRIFLEVAAMRNSDVPIPISDLKNIEQQADRAIALARTIASLVREISVPTGPWVLLDSLMDEVFNDFIVLLHSGMLTLERQWDTSIQITSSPVLRQLLVLIIGKLIGKNTRPVILTVTSTMKASRCNLELRWAASDQAAVQDARTVLGKELTHIQEMVYSIGGELAFEGETAISLKLPAAPQANPPFGRDMLQ